MRLVYISGKYSDANGLLVQENIRRATLIAAKYIRQGDSVIIPHKNYSHLDDLVSYMTWIEMDLEQVRRSDVIVMVPGWKNSPGAKLELDEAIRHGKLVIYETERTFEDQLQKSKFSPMTPHTPHPNPQAVLPCFYDLVKEQRDEEEKNRAL